MAAVSQTNGIPPPSSGSQTVGASTNPSNTQASHQQQPGTQSQAALQQASQPSQQQQQQQAQQPQQPQQPQPPPQQQQQQHLQQPQHHHQPLSPSATAPRPRDARTIELLLTAQGVTSYEQRVPLLLLDFAYRHTSSILSDALHLSADPYTSHAGSKPSAASGAAPVNVGDANISANAVQLAIASRLAFQFRGGSSGGGGVSKDWMLETARERNKVALPRVMPNEWGMRLPGERFVLNGLSWGLRDVWAGQEGGSDEDDDEDEEDEEGNLHFGGGGGAGGGGDAMEGVETEDVTGDGVEGGTMGDVFGDDGLEEDEEMVEV